MDFFRLFEAHLTRGRRSLHPWEAPRAGRPQRPWPRAFNGRERDMAVEYLAGLVASILMFVYLTYALLRPERF
jgi:K+-transporting ATPase KdpF subunit